MKNNKYDIIILAGQSNADGNGLFNDEGKEWPNDVYQVVNANILGYIEGDNGQTSLDVRPNSIVLEKASFKKIENVGYAELANTFCQEYIESGLLKEDRKLLVVKCAVGGTGFARKEWGVGNLLSNRLIDMVDFALELNKENRIVAMLWHQGEHDAFENAQLNATERYEFYKENFKNQMTMIIDRYSQFDFPIIAGEFVNEWADKYREQCDAIIKATGDVLCELKKGSVVSSEGLLSNNQYIQNGDDIHFCEKSIYKLGQRYFIAYKKLL